MTIKDNVLAKYITYKINRMNVKYAKEIIALSDKYPNRTVAVEIIDVGGGLGFAIDFSSKKIVELAAVSRPTCIMQCTLKVFKALVSGKIDPNKVYYGGFAKFVGENVLRDKVILMDIARFFQKV